MEFSSKCKIKCFQYQINIAELISPIYHLVVELSSQNDSKDDFYNLANNLFNVEKVIGVKKMPEYKNVESFCEDVALYLEDELYQKVDYLTDSRITMLYRNERKIFGQECDSRDVKKILKNWLKDFNPIKCLFEYLIIDPGAKALEEKLHFFINDVYYDKAVIVNGETQMDSTIIPYDWIQPDNCEEVVIDNEAIWVNKKGIWKETIEGGTHESKEITSKKTKITIGLILGDYVIPFERIDNIIKKEFFSQYFWKMLKDVFSKYKQLNIFPRNLSAFKNVCKESDFCRILSRLNYNLYVKKDEIEIPSKYDNFFEEVYKIQKIKHLENYNFYTNKPDEFKGQTLLGVYELKKESSNYNLLQWINTKDKNNHKSSEIEKDYDLKSECVYALRPEYSYYLISRYFEDTFCAILNELKCEFINNIELYKRGDNNAFIEIDNIVRKEDGTLIYFENKTTLTKYSVEETIIKIEGFQSLMSESYSDVKFEYVIVAPFSDETIEANYLYFIKKSGGIFKKYDFTIPLAKFEDINLRCIVEPEYEKMITLINSIIR